MERERERTTCSVAAVGWIDLVADEALWRIVGVRRDSPNEVVQKELFNDVTAIVRTGFVRES